MSSLRNDWRRHSSTKPTARKMGCRQTCVEDRPALDEEDDGQHAEQEEDPGRGEQVDSDS